MQLNNVKHALTGVHIKTHETKMPTTNTILLQDFENVLAGTYTYSERVFARIQRKIIKT